jgi:hypothetical protein
VARFKKFLCIGTESSKFSTGAFSLTRVARVDVGRIQNLCDHDAILIDLTAITELSESLRVQKEELRKVFQPDLWPRLLLGALSLRSGPELNV